MSLNIESQVFTAIIILLWWFGSAFSQWSNRTQDYIQQNWAITRVSPNKLEESQRTVLHSGIANYSFVNSAI